MSDDKNVKLTLITNIQTKVELLLQTESISEEAKLQLLAEALRLLEEEKVRGAIR